MARPSGQVGGLAPRVHQRRDGPSSRRCAENGLQGGAARFCPGRNSRLDGNAKIQAGRRQPRYASLQARVHCLPTGQGDGHGHSHYLSLRPRDGPIAAYVSIEASDALFGSRRPPRRRGRSSRSSSRRSRRRGLRVDRRGSHVVGRVGLLGGYPHLAGNRRPLDGPAPFSHGALRPTHVEWMAMGVPSLSRGRRTRGPHRRVVVDGQYVDSGPAQGRLRPSVPKGARHVHNGRETDTG